MRSNEEKWKNAKWWGSLDIKLFGLYSIDKEAIETF